MNTKIRLKDMLCGDIDGGWSGVCLLLLAVNYHFASNERFKPYIGAGMIATWYVGEEPAGGHVQDFSAMPTYAPLIKAGFDYQIAYHWYATSVGIRGERRADSKNVARATLS